MADTVKGVTHPLDPISALQASLKQFNDEYNRMVGECAGLRTQQKALQSELDGLTAARLSLVDEVVELNAQAVAARQTLEEERKAAEWWKKKEEGISASAPGPGRLLKRTGSDVPGRLARTAWLADDKCRRLEEQLKGMSAEHEAEMEGERSIAAGLRDRIGRLEARLREQQVVSDGAAEIEGALRKEAREQRDKYERDLSKERAEIADLREALKEERRLRVEHEERLGRAKDAMQSMAEDMRRSKAATITSPPRALNSIQQNIMRPQTPPRMSLTAQAKSPAPNSKPGVPPSTPRSLVRAHAYLEKRHAEAQEHNCLLKEQLRTAQSALKDIHEQHAADLTKFREWKKVESERSAVRKRKREEKRRERSTVSQGTGAGAGSSTGASAAAVAEGDVDVTEGTSRRKKRKSEVMVEASDESAPQHVRVPLRSGHPVESEAADDAEVRTSQTAQDGDVGRIQLAAATPPAVPGLRVEEQEEEEEEDQSYRSAPNSGPRSQSVLAPYSVLGASERLDQADDAIELVRRAETQQRSGSQSPQAAPVTQGQRRTTVSAAATRSDLQQKVAPRPSRAVPADSQASLLSAAMTPSATTTRCDPFRAPAVPTRPATTAISAARPTSTSPDHPSRLRRSTSPIKSPAAAHTPARTTPWLGGGNLVRTSSKQSIMTNADPFDLSPPEAASSRIPSDTHERTPPNKAAASLIRDRGETSLRKAALTRFPSDMSTNADSPLAGHLDLEGLTPDEKARRLKKLNKLSASEKREVYRGYKREGRYLGVDQVKKPVQEDYEIDPAKNEGRSHAFHDVKRKKEDRKCMHGGDCEQCHDWYAAIGPLPRYNQGPQWRDDSTAADQDAVGGVQQHQNMISRHRETWVKPSTPPGYWAIEFPTTQVVQEQNERADEMEREKEERILRETRAANSKWRKKA